MSDLSRALRGFRMGDDVTVNNNAAWYKWTRADGIFYALAPQSGSRYIGWPQNSEGETLKGPVLAEWLNKQSVRDIYPEAEVLTVAKTKKGYIESDDDDEVPYEGAMCLPAGVYEYKTSDSGYPSDMLFPIQLRKDVYIKDEEAFNGIVEELTSFRKNEALYRELDVIYKRSVLLYGPPGFGKTSLIREVLNSHLPSDAIVVFFSSSPSISLVTNVAKSLKGRLKVFVFEELLFMVDSSYNLQAFLEFMDGEKSLDGTFMFGTTNYVEKLPENIANRPSRWDRVIKIAEMSPGAKHTLLTHFLKRAPSEEELALTESLSAASIKEICLSVHLHKLSFAGAVYKMKKHIELFKKEFKEGKKMGIE